MYAISHHHILTNHSLKTMVFMMTISQETNSNFLILETYNESFWKLVALGSGLMAQYFLMLFYSYEEIELGMHFLDDSFIIYYDYILSLIVDIWVRNFDIQ